MVWIVFTDKAGKELLSYTAKDTFPGEMEATKELLAYEHGINSSEISTAMKKTQDYK
ncbi:MAG: hypothetical protein PHS57_06270 [Alphaproteobacteria bacterium]|nr:hypothetical protein [Alphaproteobacteria bacterium]